MIIGLCGVTFCSVNYGVSALAYSQISLINECAKKMNIDAEYYVFSMDVQKAEEVYNICKSFGIVNIKIFNPARIKTGIHGLTELKKRMKECDVVFDLTKGDSFSDIYGYKRFVLQAIEKRCAIKNSKLVISPQTIGPFKNSFVKREAQYEIENAISVFARDEKSQKCVEEICPSKKVTTTSDLAFYLPYLSSEKYSVNNKKLYIGINLSGLLWNGGYTGQNEFGLKCDYKLFTYQIIEWFHNYKNCDIYVFAHVYMNGGDDDYAVCEELQKRYSYVKIAPKFSNPIEAKSFMTKLDLVIGARMHATIGAISSGTPVLPFSYSRKFEGLYNSIGYDYVIQATQWDTDYSIRFVKEAVDNLELLGVKAEKAVQAALEKNKVYKEAILNILAEISK